MTKPLSGRRRPPSALTAHTVLKVALLAGISYAALPADSAQAQTVSRTARHHTAAHRSPTKKTATHAVAPRSTPATATTTVGAVSPAVSVRNASVLQQGTEAQSAEHISVTGSRLSQTFLTNNNAGHTVGDEQITARGYTNIGLALLRENTAYSLPSNSPIGSQGSYGAGQTFGGLFNLGTQRMLTLVNGRRFVGGASASAYASSSGSQVDLSIIPTSLIKKVETVYGGAGAAYGADAVAGVQNYILDDDYQGVSLLAQGGFTQRLDDGSEKIAFKFGRHFDHDRGGVVFDVEYRNNDGLTGYDRPYTYGPESGTYSKVGVGRTSAYTYPMQTDRRYLQVAVTGIPMSSGGGLPVRNGVATNAFRDANGHALVFSPNGQSLISQTYNYAFTDNRAGSGGNGPSLSALNNLQTPQNTLNLTTLGHYDFSEHLKANWEGWYSRGQATSTIAQGYWTTSLYGDDPLTMDNYLQNGSVNGNYVFNTNNPYLTPAERTTIVNGLAAKGLPTDKFYMTRLNQDLDGGKFRTDSQVFRFAGGFSGDFDAVGRNFGWSVNGTYGKYMNDTWQPQVTTQNLINALDAVTDASGNIVCAPGSVNSTAQTRSSVCSPIDLFGTHRLTPAARDYVTADSYAKNTNAQRDFTAEIHSTVMKLPAGDIRWDIGYEHRREGYNFNPGAFNRGEELPDGTYRQYGNSTSIPNTSGAYHTHEAFGELDVPLVSPNLHIPAVYDLQAQANGRYVNNSMTGGAWTYKFGGVYMPNRDIKLSGNYAQSVRAPSVTELFAPTSTDYESGSDPCSYQFINSGPNPATRAANCRAAGVPDHFDSDYNYGTKQGTTGGNAHLQNETSKSFTGNLDYRPHYIRGLSLGASFIDVKVKNEIVSLGSNDLLDACYDSASYPNSYCSAVQRDPSTFQITNFQAGNYNIANQHMQALQANLSYQMPLSRVGLGENAGDAQLTVNYTHYVKNTQSYLTSVYQLQGTTGSPNDLFTANLNYMRGPLFVQWQTIYYGPSAYALQVASNVYQNNKRDQYFYFNTTIGYQFAKHFDVNFMMNNVTDAKPPANGLVSMTRYWDAYLGRQFLVQLGAHF